MVDPEQPWYWEGNVQRVAVAALKSDGWTIRSTADTATRRPGIDIVASLNERALWVSVKGYPVGTPRTKPPTQARHWFSQAIFDLICYRTDNPTVELALCLPDIGATYRNLCIKSEWALMTLPASVIWITEQGSCRWNSLGEVT